MSVGWTSISDIFSLTKRTNIEIDDFGLESSVSCLTGMSVSFSGILLMYMLLGGSISLLFVNKRVCRSRIELFRLAVLLACVLVVSSSLETTRV